MGYLRLGDDMSKNGGSFLSTDAGRTFLRPITSATAAADLMTDSARSLVSSVWKSSTLGSGNSSGSAGGEDAQEEKSQSQAAGNNIVVIVDLLPRLLEKSEFRAKVCSRSLEYDLHATRACFCIKYIVLLVICLWRPSLAVFHNFSVSH